MKKLSSDFLAWLIRHERIKDIERRRNAAILKRRARLSKKSQAR
jgi:hypothetical protein